MRQIKLVTAFMVLISGLMACAQKIPQPKTISAAESIGYAVSFPAEVTSLFEQYAERKTWAEQNMVEFGAFPDQLTDPDWQRTAEILERAGEAGRTEAFAANARADREIRAFHAEQHDALVKRVAGAVQKAAQKEGQECEFEGYGAVSYSLKRAVPRVLEERQRERNDARQLLMEYERELGKKSVATLEKQIDEISLTSYIVHVELPQILFTLNARIEQARKVGRTLDNGIEHEQERLAASDLPKKEKRTRQARLADYQAARAALDPAVKKADDLLRAEIDDQSPDLMQDKFEFAIDDLLEKLNQRAELQVSEADDKSSKSDKKRSARPSGLTDKNPAEKPKDTQQPPFEY